MKALILRALYKSTRFLINIIKRNTELIIEIEIHCVTFMSIAPKEGKQIHETNNKEYTLKSNFISAEIC